MSIQRFPLIAIVFGITLGAFVVFGSTAGADGERRLPLLTLLVMSEFAMIVTAIGAWIAARRAVGDGSRGGSWIAVILCSGLAVFFLLRGIALWPL